MTINVRAFLDFFFLINSAANDKRIENFIAIFSGNLNQSKIVKLLILKQSWKQCVSMIMFFNVLKYFQCRMQILLHLKLDH